MAFLLYGFCLHTQLRKQLWQATSQRSTAIFRVRFAQLFQLFGLKSSSLEVS